MKCKYCKPSMDILRDQYRKYANHFDDWPRGPLSLILDSCKQRDEDIKQCIERCNEYPNKEVAELGIAICEGYLKMSMLERAIFDGTLCGWTGHCGDKGHNCDIYPHVNDYETIWHIDFEKEGLLK